MKVTSQVSAAGHYIEIQDEHGSMSIRTERGEPAELAYYAEELEAKAARLTRTANRVRAAARELTP